MTPTLEVALKEKLRLQVISQWVRDNVRFRQVLLGVGPRQFPCGRRLHLRGDDRALRYLPTVPHSQRRYRPALSAPANLGLTQRSPRWRQAPHIRRIAWEYFVYYEVQEF